MRQNSKISTDNQSRQEMQRLLKQMESYTIGTSKLQSNIMHKLHLIENHRVENKAMPKLLTAMNVLWSEILKRNKIMEIKYQAQKKETKAWIHINNQNIQLIIHCL